MKLDRARLADLRARAQAKARALASRPRPARPSLPQRPTITNPKILAAQQQHRRRRQRVLLTILALALLLLFARFCDCAPEPVVTPPVPELVCPAVPDCGVGDPPTKKKPSTSKPTKPAAPKATAAPLERDQFAVPIRRTPAWLAALRLQVTARSLELAVCFNGAEKPGALRWTTTVTPASGAVADSELEPVLRGPPLTAQQQQCVLGVLSRRPFKLDAGDDVIGTRVSLIIEF